MLGNTVRWSISIAFSFFVLLCVTPTAFAGTILEFPRSDVRLICAGSLTSTPIVTPESSEKKTITPSQKPKNNSVYAAEISVAPARISTYAPSQEKPAHSLNADKMFDIINSYRSRIGLTAFQKDQAICDIAKQRGPELDREVETGTIHAGFRARNLPYWATENMKYGGTEEEMFQWWLNSSVHSSAIHGDYQYSCGECYGRSCVQIFTNYQPK